MPPRITFSQARFQHSRWVWLVAVAACTPSPRDTGLVDPIVAHPVEHLREMTVGPGETLGGLLAPVLDGPEWGDAVLAFRSQADPRRIRTGSLIVVRSSSETGAVRAIDIQLNPDESVRLVREIVGAQVPAWRGERVLHESSMDTVAAGGVIVADLWSAVVENPVLSGLSTADRARFIHALDQVFQWQIDFTVQMRKGDGYRFVSEREVRLDGSVKLVRILAAEIVNAGSSVRAVWFDPNDDGRGSYFDEDGESVRRAFLLRPLEYRRISSRFSPSRFHPILQTWRAHRGVDYAADQGTPVMATGNGVIVSRGVNGGLGNAVEIRHPSGFVTRYGHLSRFARRTNVGTPVSQGQVIGYVGMTGLATGPHLHYEMIRSGRHVDPLSVDLPADDPVPAESVERWEPVRDAALALLETIPMKGVADVAVDGGDGPG